MLIGSRIVKFTSKFNKIFLIIQSPIHIINLSLRPDTLSFFKPKKNNDIKT